MSTFTHEFIQSGGRWWLHWKYTDKRGWPYRGVEIVTRTGRLQAIKRGKADAEAQSKEAIA